MRAIDYLKQQAAHTCVAEAQQQPGHALPLALALLEAVPLPVAQGCRHSVYAAFTKVHKR
jgi:hypothetical protein